MLSHLCTVYMTNNCPLEVFWVELLSFSHVSRSIYGQEQQVVIAKLSHQSVEAHTVSLLCCVGTQRACFFFPLQGPVRSGTHTHTHHSQTFLLFRRVSYIKLHEKFSKNSLFRCSWWETAGLLAKFSSNIYKRKYQRWKKSVSFMFFLTSTFFLCVPGLKEPICSTGIVCCWASVSCYWLQKKKKTLKTLKIWSDLFQMTSLFLHFLHNILNINFTRILQMELSLFNWFVKETACANMNATMRDNLHTMLISNDSAYKNRKYQLT